MDKFSHTATGLAAFSLRRPVTVFLLSFTMLVFGIVSSRLLPLEKFPGIDIPWLWVAVPYKDATPSEVDKRITQPLEEALATMSGVKSMRSNSNENRAEVGLQFEWDEKQFNKVLKPEKKSMPFVIYYQTTSNVSPSINLIPVTSPYSSLGSQVPKIYPAPTICSIAI